MTRKPVLSLTQAELELELVRWAVNNEHRDNLLWQAHAAGISKYRIHKLTGIARTTIDRVLMYECEHCGKKNVPRKLPGIGYLCEECLSDWA